MTLLFGVFGASGFGREVMPVVRAQFRALQTEATFVFVDDNPPATKLNGHACLTFDEFSAADADQKRITLAIANPIIRAEVASRCSHAGLEFLAVQAGNVCLLDDVCIGPGSILAPFVTLTSNVRIGDHFHANLYSYVAHDCVIGNFVTFAPAVKCNGNVVVEDNVYLGTGAIIRQGQPDRPLVIGHGAVVGMGAVITKSVPAGATVVGNPARLLQKH